MGKYIIFFIFLTATLGAGCQVNQNKTDAEINSQKGDDMSFEINKSEDEWKKELAPEQYRVLREKGTEAPFTGQYYVHDDEGIYKCAACGNELFYSDSKFDSHCGWPSFYKPVSDNSVIEKEDRTHGMVRTEILCGKCGSHLGHVFEDGPDPTGLRYCINSVSLNFKDSSQSK